MLDTSKDLLFLVLALCALLFTGFICVLLYHFISITNNVRGLAKGVKQKLDLIDEVLTTLKNKITSSASYIGLLVNAVEKIVEHIQQKRSANADKKTRKKAKLADEE